MKIFFCACFVLSTVPVCAQTNGIDSLISKLNNAKEDTLKVNILNELFKLCISSEPEKANGYAQKALKLAGEINWKKGTGNSLQNIGLYYFYKEDRSNAFSFWLRALNISIELNDQAGQANSLGNIALVSDNSAGLEYLFKALKLNERINRKTDVAKNLGNIALVYSQQGQYSPALEYFFKAFNIHSNMGNRKSAAMVLGNIGNVYVNQSMYPKALEYYFKALKIHNDLGNKRSQAKVLGSIGSVYIEQSDYPKAIEYFSKALKIAEENDYKTTILINLGNIGNVFYNQSFILPGQRDSLLRKAQRHYFSALKMSETLENKYEIARNLGNIANIYCVEGHFQKVPSAKSDSLFRLALTKYFEALKIDEELEDVKGEAQDLGNISSLFFEVGNTGRFNESVAQTRKKNYDDCEKYLKRALHLCNSFHLLRETANYEMLYSSLDSARNNYKGSFEHYKKHIAARDSIINRENTKKQTRLEMNYEFDKKQTTDSIFAAEEKKIAVAELKTERNKSYTLYGGLCLLLIFAGFIYNRFRVTRKQKNIIEYQKLTVEEQKKIVEEKNKDIMDSIRYAERIQRSLLPNEKYFKRHLQKR